MRDEIVDYQGVEEEGDETVSFYPAKKGAVVVVVGYALTSKKIKSFLQPKFQDLARYPLLVPPFSPFYIHTNICMYFYLCGFEFFFKKKNWWNLWLFCYCVMDL